MIVPYLGIACLLALLALLMARFPFPAVSRTALNGRKDFSGSVWTHRHLVLGALALFAYVGAKVAIGSFLVNYLMQPEITGLPTARAATYVLLYWGGAMVGRFAGSAVLRRVNTGSAVGVAAVFATLLVATSILTTGNIAMWSILMVGLFNSILFPSIFTLGIANLGPLTPKGSSLLIAAIVGGAVIPRRRERWRTELDYISLSCCRSFAICISSSTVS